MIIISYLEVYNYLETNDNKWNHKILYRILISDKNTWNYAIVHKLFELGRKTWGHITVQTNDYRHEKSVIWKKNVNFENILIIGNKYL